MAVSYVATGANASGTTSLSVAYPSGVAVGDLLFMYVANKNSSVTPTVPSGWTQVFSTTGGTGSDGSGTGLVRLTGYYRVATTALTGSQTVTITSANVSMAHMQLYRKASTDFEYSFYPSSFSKTTSSTTFSGTPGAFINLKANDLLVFLNVSTNMVSTSAQTFGSAADAVLSSATEDMDAMSLAGNLLSYASAHGSVVSGNSSANSTLSATMSGATTGVGLFMKVTASAVSGAAVKNDLEHFTVDPTTVGIAGSGSAAYNNDQFSMNSGTKTATKALAAHGQWGLQFPTNSATTNNLSLTPEAPNRYFSTMSYFYLTGLPSSAIQWQSITNYNANTGVARLIIQTAANGGSMGLQNAAGSTVQQSNVPIPLNQWLRCEFRVDQGTSTTSGTAVYTLYQGDTNTVIDSISVIGQNFGYVLNGVNTLPGRANFGKNSSAGTMNGFYLDDLNAISGIQTEVGYDQGSVSGTAGQSGVVISGAATMSGSTTGTGSSSATVSGSFTATGSTSGGGSSTGSVSGSTVKSGSASAIAGPPGAALSGFTITSGATSGSGSVSANLSAVTTHSGSTTGAGSASAVVSGGQPAAGSVTGTGTSTGAASGSMSPSASVTGTGSSIATVSGSRASQGSVAVNGNAAGAVSGSTTTSGSATGVGTSAGSVSGSITTAGTATGAGSSSGSVSGSTTNSGSVSGAGNSTATLSGSAPVVGVNSGSVSGTGSSSAIVSGFTFKSGSATGASGASVTVVAVTTRSGSTSGSGPSTGLASGTSGRFGDVTGGGSSSASVSGSTNMSGSVSGLNNCFAVIVGEVASSVEISVTLSSPTLDLSLENDLDVDLNSPDLVLNLDLNHYAPARMKINA